MTKARIGMYSTKGEALARTHRPCPKCGPGIFLAEHADRRSCGRCGYSESRPASEPRAVPAPAKPEKGKGAKPPAKPSPASPAAKPASASPATPATKTASSATGRKP